MLKTTPLGIATATHPRTNPTQNPGSHLWGRRGEKWNSAGNGAAENTIAMGWCAGGAAALMIDMWMCVRFVHRGGGGEREGGRVRGRERVGERGRRERGRRERGRRERGKEGGRKRGRRERGRTEREMGARGRKRGREGERERARGEREREERRSKEREREEEREGGS